MMAAQRSSRQPASTQSRVLRWVNHADLMRVVGVGPQFAELLEAAGVDSVPGARAAECGEPRHGAHRDERRAEPGAPGAERGRGHRLDRAGESASARRLSLNLRRGESVTEISAALVKELREATGAGMMDCKRALQDTDGDLDAARTLLREKSMAQAGKRADRATTEGLVGTIVESGVGTIVGIGCETEPVSKNDEFQSFAERVLRAVHADGVDAAATFDEERMELMGKLGENIVVAGTEHYDDGGTIAAYVQLLANKIGVLVDLDGGDEALARQLAMHISFAAPEWATRDDVSPEAIEAERQVYLNLEHVLSKPEAAREKIVDGMLGKRFFAAAPGVATDRIISAQQKQKGFLHSKLS